MTRCNGFLADGAFNQAHSKEARRSDGKTLAVSVAVGNTIATSGEPGLTGYGGDVFLSPAVAILFIETAKIFVPLDLCEGRRVDFETWRLIGDSAEESAEERLSTAQSGNGVGNPLVDPSQDALDDAALNSGASEHYNLVSSELRAGVKSDLDTVFDEGVWNTHMLHSLHDIVRVRIPVLERRKVSRSPLGTRGTLLAACSGAILLCLIATNVSPINLSGTSSRLHPVFRALRSGGMQPGSDAAAIAKLGHSATTG